MTGRSKQRTAWGLDWQVAAEERPVLRSWAVRFRRAGNVDLVVVRAATSEAAKASVLGRPGVEHVLSAQPTQEPPPKRKATPGQIELEVDSA